MGRNGNANQQTCAVCEHGQRAQIEAMLTRNTPTGMIAAQFGIRGDVIEVHRDNHLPVIRPVRRDPESLLADLDYSRQLAETIFTSAAADNKLAIAISALREMREATTAIAKFSHIEQALDSQTYIPEWKKIRDKILSVVEQFPQIREPMLRALELEDRSSKDGDE